MLDWHDAPHTVCCRGKHHLGHEKIELHHVKNYVLTKTASCRRTCLHKCRYCLSSLSSSFSSLKEALQLWFFRRSVGFMEVLQWPHRPKADVEKIVQLPAMNQTPGHLCTRSTECLVNRGFHKDGSRFSQEATRDGSHKHSKGNRIHIFSIHTISIWILVSFWMPIG